MAVDLVKLKSDMNRLPDADLDSLRIRVDAALIVSPEDELADQVIGQVLQSFRANRDNFVMVTITARNGQNFDLDVATSLVPATGFIKVRRWLFDWFNKRKD